MNDNWKKARDERLKEVKWKPCEINIVKNNYQSYSDKEISDQLLKGKRSRRAVQIRRLELGLYRAMQIKQVWTPEELKLLYDNWKDYDQRELKEKFFPDKTVEQVRAAKMHRGLKKIPVWSNKERALLVEHGANYCYHDLQAKFFPNKTLSQISGMRRHLGVRRRRKSNV